MSAILGLGDLQEREQSLPALINMLEQAWLKKDDFSIGSEDRNSTYAKIWKTIVALGEIGEREQTVPILFSKLQNISKEGGFNARYVETICEALEAILSLGRFKGQYSE